MGDARSPLWSECPRPSLDGKVAQMPVLDPRIATFLAKFIKDPKKGIDRSWRACQDKLLDALGPITMLLDRAEDARLSSALISPEALSGWAQRAVVFFGNANCALSTERRRSFLIKVDPKLGDLADSKAGAVAQGGLFGEPFIKELGKFVNTFTSLDRAQTSIRKVFPWVFRGAGRGRGRSSGHNAQVSRGQGSRQGQYQNNQLYTNFYPSRGRRGRGRGFRGGDNSSAAGKCNPRVLSMRGRPVSRLCESVGTDHVRHLGATNCSRFQDRVLWRTQAVDSSLTDPFLSLRGTPDRRRGRGLIRKTGHLQYRVAFTGFPEQYVWCREDGRGPASCLEPTRIQRVVGLPPLQDGGHTPQRCLATRGLDGPPRFKRCLSGHSYFSSAQEVSSISMVKASVPVYVSSFRTFLRSMVFHEGPPAGRGIPSSEGNSSDPVFRRYAFTAARSTSAQRPATTGGQSLGEPGIRHKYEKIFVDPVASGHFSGVCDQLSRRGPKPSNAQALQNSSRVTAGPSQTDDSSSSDSPHCWAVVSDYPGDFSRFASLQGLVTPKSVPPKTRLPIFPPSFPIGRGSGRDSMVALPHGSMEREGNFWFRAGFSHRIQHQQVRLGCQVWRFLHRRLLVSAGASPSHQLSGAPSGLFRSEMLDQGQSSVVCPAKDGQCIGGSVHQPSRGHPFQGTVGPGIGSAAILPGPSHLASGGISPRTGEYGSGLAIASLQRFQSLEASSGRFFCSTRLLGSFFSGSFCLEAGSPDSSIFQLASGSVGSGHRCVPTGLDAGAALCVSTVRNDYSGLCPSQETKSELGAHHANLEVASVVSSSTGTFLGFSNPTPPLSLTTSQSRSPSSPNGTQRGATPDGVEDYRGR